MLLKDLLNLLDNYETVNFNNIEITGISYNSSKVENGNIFICIKGEASDGHDYALQAVNKGAAALFCEKELDINVPQIIVKDTKRTMAYIAAKFYDEPSKKINLIGV